MKIYTYEEAKKYIDELKAETVLRLENGENLDGDDTEEAMTLFIYVNSDEKDYVEEYRCEVVNSLLDKYC